MKTLFAALLLSLVWVGCSSKEPSDNHVKAGDQVGSSDNTAAQVERLIDPVSGETVRKDEAWSAMYKGNWYFFSSEENARKFASDPMAFVTEDGRIKRELEAK
jgi:YHS domain-containing protein